MSTQQDEGKAELLQMILELPEKDQIVLWAMSNALLEHSAGKMSESDAAEFEAVKQRDVYNPDAIEAWLYEHGYIVRSAE
jgi:hypothetical protein